MTLPRFETTLLILWGSWSMPEFNRAENLLRDLVAIPSPSGEEAAASNFLAAWMNTNGFQATVDPSGSAVGIRGEGSREIVLLGHIDTFPGDLPVREDGRRLYGRGSVDAKGSLAAFAAAAAVIDPPAGTRLVVIGATEEEASTSKGARHAVTQFNPAACLIGEPSGWDRITLGYKGCMQMKWSWQGPLAHSASPSASAAERAVNFWRTAEQYADDFNQDQSGIFRQLSLSLSALNTLRQGAYETAEMEISMRLPLGLSAEVLENQLRSLGNSADLSFFGQEPAFLAPKAGFLTRSLLGAVRAAGGQPRFVHKSGTSDMNVVGPEWDCPIAAYGPGDSSLDHTPDEHLDLDEYQRSIQVLHGAISEMLQDNRR
jgi:[amino group carrier protein]-lysine/ornithine hydrolase